jgi:hypothetical protein
LIKNTFNPLPTLQVFRTPDKTFQLSVGFTDKGQVTHEIRKLPEYDDGISHLRDREYSRVFTSLSALLDFVAELDQKSDNDLEAIGLEARLKAVPNIEKRSTQQPLAFNRP